MGYHRADAIKIIVGQADQPTRAAVNRRLVVAPLGKASDRTRATCPQLGQMVELRRVDALSDALVPDWLAEGGR